MLNIAAGIIVIVGAIIWVVYVVCRGISLISDGFYDDEYFLGDIIALVIMAMAVLRLT